jgi:hypothetical protein
MLYLPSVCSNGTECSSTLLTCKGSSKLRRTYVLASSGIHQKQLQAIYGRTFTDNTDKSTTICLNISKHGSGPHA